MQYSNDGWGPDNLDKVFAHEIGHAFNARDEYTNCNCYQYYGESKVLAPLGTATVPHIIITGLHALAIRSAAL